MKVKMVPIQLHDYAVCQYQSFHDGRFSNLPGRDKTALDDVAAGPGDVTAIDRVGERGQRRSTAQVEELGSEVRQLEAKPQTLIYWSWTHEGDRVEDQVNENAECAGRRPDKDSNEGVDCVQTAVSTVVPLRRFPARLGRLRLSPAERVARERDSRETMMPQIPATSKSRSRSRYELFGKPTFFHRCSSEAAIAITTTDVRKVRRATGAMVNRTKRSVQA